MAQSGQGKKIGLLGGSFNPAHSGHVYISQKALELLGLDEVWWLVSPQNPLKETSGMAPFKERFAKATELASSCKGILVSDFEYNLVHSKKPNPTALLYGESVAYTYNTLLAIKAAYSDNNFVWIMGADNMLQFPKWYKWREIMQLIPIAVFNRGAIEEKTALSGEFAKEFSVNKLNNPMELASRKTPAWVFLDIEPNPISSTQLRGEPDFQK